jgi:hypothetical protein
VASPIASEAAVAVPKVSESLRSDDHAYAAAVVAAMPVPRDFAGYRESVRLVAEAVADRAGCTPLEALTERINPLIFMRWKREVEEAAAPVPVRESKRRRPRAKPSQLEISVTHTPLPIDLNVVHEPIEFAPIEIREGIAPVPSVLCNPIINVNVPQQPPATVDVTVNPADVILPERKTSTVIDRDGNGLISRVVQTEEDVNPNG